MADHTEEARVDEEHARLPVSTDFPRIKLKSQNQRTGQNSHLGQLNCEFQSLRDTTYILFLN